MADRRALVDALRFVAEQVLAKAEESVVLAALCDRAAQALEAAGCGIVLVDEDAGLQDAASTDALVEQLSLLQARMREGPAWQSAQSGEVVSSGDLSRDQRWPAFAEVAAEAGLRSIICLPLTVDDRCLGTLCAVREQVGEHEAEDVEAGGALASTTAALLHNLRERERAAELIEQLERALRSRIVIEQAKGMLAATLGMSPDEAFVLLRRTARNRRERLHDIARAVLAGKMEIDA